MSKKQAIFWRVYLTFFMMAALALGICIKIVKIQSFEGEMWRSLGETLYTEVRDVEASRGNIYAEDGSLLATSLTIYELRLDLMADGITKDTFEKNLEPLATSLANYYKGEGEKSKWEWISELKKAYKTKNRYYKIRSNVSHDQLRDIKKFPLLRLGRYKGGFIAIPEIKRKKPFNTLANRTIGISKENTTNPCGIENSFDKYLAGQNGKRLVQLISTKEWIPVNDASEIEPVHGYDVHSTLNVVFQEFCEAALMKSVKENNAHHGSVILMEVSTGKIVGIANLLLNREKGTCYEGFNYAIGEATAPGSTFKVAALMALLDQGYMDPEDTIGTGNGQWKHFDLIMHDSGNNGKGFGVITLQQVIELSSNIGIAKAMTQNYGMQQQKFIDFLYKAKLNEKTGVEIQGEPIPIIKSPKDKSWSGTTLAWMSHGYELNITPLQTLTLYNIIANHGTAMKPMVATSVKNIDEIVEIFEPIALAKNVVSERTCSLAIEILSGAVEIGTGKISVKSNKLHLCGKTGTAVLNKSSEGIKHYQSSFAGFFPKENPKYSCIVVINDPVGGKYYGADVAGPVFKEIAEKVYSIDIEMHAPQYATTVHNPKIRPTFLKAHVEDVNKIYNALTIDVEPNKDNAEWVEPFLKGNEIALKSKESTDDTVPDLKGLSLSDAIYLSENAGLKVKFDGNGNVYRQIPEAGKPAKKGNIIYINLK